MKKTPNPILFLVLTVVALAAGAGGVYWQWNSNADEQVKLDALNKQLAREKKLGSELERTIERVQLSAEQLAHLEQNVSELAYVPTLLTELEQIGADNGVKITGVRPKEEKKKPKKKPASTDKDAAKDEKPEPEPKKAYDELLVEVKGVCDYWSGMKFVAAIEKFPKIVALRSVEMNPKRIGRDATQSMLELTLEVKVFFFPAPVAPTTTAQKGPLHDELG